MRIIAFVAAFVLMTSFTLGAQAPAAGEPPAIMASGQAVLTRAPDRAYIQIGAEGRAAKAPEAQQIAATSMTGVQNALKRFNLPADAIKTLAYSVQPEFDYQNGRQQFRDYLARNVIEVRVDDVASVGQLVDAVGGAGAAAISGLRWDLKDRGAVEQEALTLAVKDAMARARAMASGGGLTLGPVIRLQEQRTSAPMPVMALARAAAPPPAPTPIETGQIEVRADVMLTIGLK
jgi:uncharacterized protein YggE